MDATARIYPAAPANLEVRASAAAHRAHEHPAESGSPDARTLSRRLDNFRRRFIR